MKRNQELEDYIKEYRKERKERKMGRLSAYVQKLSPSFLENMDVLVREQERRQKEEKGEPVKYVFLCRLMSSYYTESYDAVLGLGSVKLYLDEKKSQVFWKPAPVYEGIDRDMGDVEKLIRKKYIRLQESELFHIKRKLLEDDWDLLQEGFRILSGKASQRMGDGILETDEKVLFLCGDYMERLKIIGNWERDGMTERE